MGVGSAKHNRSMVQSQERDLQDRGVRAAARREKMSPALAQANPVFIDEETEDLRCTVTFLRR